MQSSHEQLLSTIRELNTQARESALVVVGDVGAGKSALLEEAHRRDPSATSLVRINPGEAAWPLSGISAVLGGVTTPRVTLPMPTPDEFDIASIGDDILHTLRGRDSDRLTLLVDNIDLLDDASRQLLGHLCGHLAGTGISVVATAVQVSAGEPLSGVKRMTIGLLDDPTAERLAPRNIHRGTLRMLTWATSRNPAALLSRIDELDDEQLTGREPIAYPLPPGRPARALATRVLAQLDPVQLAVLDRLSMCALHGRASVAGWIDGADDALQDLIDRGIARERSGYVRMTNNLVRSAVGAAVGSVKRRELHAVLQAHAHPVIAPWHASFADPDPGIRSELLAAATRLVALGYPTVAVEFADRAVLLGRGGLVDELADFADELMLAGELALADRALHLASVEAGDGATLAPVRARVAFVAGRLEAGRDAELFTVPAPQHAPTDTPPANDPPLIAAAARRAIFAEDYAGARVLIRSLTHAVRRPSRVWLGWIAALSIECWVRSGHYDRAFEVAHNWNAVDGASAGPASFIPLPVWARLAATDTPGAQHLLAEWSARAGARAGGLPAALGLTLEAGLIRFTGENHRAVELLQLADAVVDPNSDPSHSRHLVDLIEALAESGRLELARDTVTRLENAVARYPSRWAAVAMARAHVVTANDRDAAEAIRRARDACARAESPFDRGTLLQAISRRLTQQGELSLAEQSASDARVAFASANALMWMARGTANRALASSHDADPAETFVRPLLEALSADERAVVELVEAGLHNKEIASKLYVSVRTVELRLTHIYRKLGARSRAHLMSLLR